MLGEVDQFELDRRPAFPGDQIPKNDDRHTLPIGAHDLDFKTRVRVFPVEQAPDGAQRFRIAYKGPQVIGVGHFEANAVRILQV